MEQQLFKKVSANKLFSGIDINTLNFRNIYSDLIEVKAGNVIFRKNDLTEFIYLIIKGEVNLVAHQFMNKAKADTSSKVIKSDEFFGYDELYNSTSRESTAVALTDVELLVVSSDDLNKLIIQELMILNNLKSNLLGVKTLTDYSYEESSAATKDGGKKTKTLYDFKQKIDQPENDLSNTSERSAEVSDNEKYKVKESLKIEKENVQISMREEEIKNLRESLYKEKAIAEEFIQKELDDLTKRENEFLLNEKSFEEQKKTTEKELKEKHKLLDEKQKEIEIAISREKGLAKLEKELSLRESKFKEEKLKTEEDHKIRLTELNEQKKIIEENLTKEKDLDKYKD